MKTNQSQKLKTQSGMGLVEVIAALGVAILVISSLVALSIFTLRNASQSQLLLKATKDVNRQMELLRAFRDTSAVWYADTGNSFIGTGGVQECDGAANCLVCDGKTAFTSATSTCPTDGSGYSVVAVSGVSDPATYPYRPNEILLLTHVSDSLSSSETSSVVSGGVATQRIRVKVSAYWKVGNSVKNTSVYTDLSNWQNK